ncbi:NAD(P)H dehydrogenase (quinone) [Rahnella sp. BIGb0236]|uniref:SDR family oxidoreductase n=1 Tax=Rahnella victoriana TaxID=1510570 RepID=A0ABS0DVN0_9GAMM|nr:SDR family oxidoreductase [Rahnella victoriana]TDS98260.1 NAD(P)H dehydrogenase (quinone) [Rahnella sp. BIGb0236]
MIAITGANGQLGKLVVKGLLNVIPADEIIAAVRNPEKSDDLRALGVQVREADYDRPETLLKAFEGVDKVLLISAVVPGERLRQHKAAISAAKQAGVGVLAYTSMLRADTSRMTLAVEHRETERYLKDSGLDFIILRNGWYLENNTGALIPAIEQGAIIGSAGQGRFASAARADYAAAAVSVLTHPGHTNKTYELAGDESFSMSEFAEAVSKQVGRTIAYNDMPPTKYESILLSFGLPKIIVDVIIDADVKSLSGELNSSSNDLSQLIGRSTTTLSDAIQAALTVQPAVPPKEGLPVIEIVTFTLKPSVTAAQFILVDRLIEAEYVSKCPGFLSRESAPGPNNTWLAIIHWQSVGSADASMKGIVTAPGADKLMSMIVPESMGMTLYGW